MNRTKYSWVLLFFFGIPGFSLQAADNPIPLREGLEFTQVEGTARINERTKAWRFVTHKTLKHGEMEIPTGTELTILPSSALDKIIAYAGQEDFVPVRIDAIVTRYRNNNFLFIFDAVPLKKTVHDGTSAETGKPAEEKPKPSQEEKINILKSAADPNQPSVIPPEILQRMKPKQKTDFTRMQETAEKVDITEDRMLVNRTGQFSRHDSAGIFVLDGFGRNISGRSFTLLPCQTLEQTENQLRRAFGRQRYRVSGIVTVFRGKPFLLMQGAARTYTHGNFTP